MRKERAELRRGLRALIQRTSEELKELSGRGVEAPVEGFHPFEEPAGIREQGRQGREELRREGPEKAGTSGAGLHPLPVKAPEGHEGQAERLRFIPQTRHGVCWAYYVNAQCWELPDAFCNQALHICMLRNCPVYRLHREEMERRFAGKFRYLW
ncbi:MAG: hypothetical protein QN198_11290 [Armatimonadota bacterium]|nr:hypothetical protein [Armatimonadota bacterium]MDR5704169.1 hypothetical protein [Armatimonadota bacterium]